MGTKVFATPSYAIRLLLLLCCFLVALTTVATPSDARARPGAQVKSKSRTQVKKRQASKTTSRVKHVARAATSTRRPRTSSTRRPKATPWTTTATTTTTPTPTPTSTTSTTEIPLAAKRFGFVNVAGWGAPGLQLARGAGITDDRQEFTPGQPFSQVDATFTTAADSRVRLLPLLNQYGDFATMNAAALADWTRRFVARYGRNGAFWQTRGRDGDLAPTTYELFNEPTGQHFGPRHNPAGYAAIFIAMASSGRLADPGAKFLIAGACDTQIDGVWRPWIDWLLDANANLKAQIDGVTVHPYGDLDGDPNWNYGCVRRMHDDMVRRKLAVPVWITEVGQTTAGGERPVTEAQQAEFLRYYINDAASLPWVAGLYLYGMRDSGTDMTDPEQHFGVVSSDGRLKPGYAAVRLSLAALGR